MNWYLKAVNLCFEESTGLNINLFSLYKEITFSPTWIKVMMFRALLLVERVMLTNSEAFSNPSWSQVNPVGPKTLKDSIPTLRRKTGRYS